MLSNAAEDRFRVYLIQMCVEKSTENHIFRFWFSSNSNRINKQGLIFNGHSRALGVVGVVSGL
jgi:hypothetical protein